MIDKCDRAIAAAAIHFQAASAIVFLASRSKRWPDGGSSS